MKRTLIVAGLLVAGVSAIYAATCTDKNGFTLTGQTCTIVNGQCSCTGNGN